MSNPNNETLLLDDRGSDGIVLRTSEDDQGELLSILIQIKPTTPLNLRSVDILQKIKPLIDQNLILCADEYRSSSIIPLQQLPADILTQYADRLYPLNGKDVIFLKTLAVTYTLNNAPYQLTQYQVKSILFELLYTITVLHEHNINHGDISVNNIYLQEVPIDRCYTISGVRYRIISNLVPILMNFTGSGTDSLDISSILSSVQAFSVARIPLSETFVNMLIEAIQLNNKEPVSIDRLLRLPLFDDLKSNSPIATRSRKKDYVSYSL